MKEVLEKEGVISEGGDLRNLFSKYKKFDIATHSIPGSCRILPNLMIKIRQDLVKVGRVSY